MDLLSILLYLETLKSYCGCCFFVLSLVVQGLCIRISNQHFEIIESKHHFFYNEEIKAFKHKVLISSDQLNAIIYVSAYKFKQHSSLESTKTIQWTAHIKVIR